MTLEKKVSFEDVKNKLHAKAFIVRAIIY